MFEIEIEKIIDVITNDKFYQPIITIFVAIVLYSVISKLIIKVSKINNKLGRADSGYNKRKSTIISLINNIIKYFIAVVVIIIILDVYGVNTKNLMASIGIVGAIVGLAFQDIIKDLLSGIFIIFDNAYAVGDYVDIDGFKGNVISVGLKTTKIRAYTGEVLVLSNSSFSKVINYNLHNPTLLLYIPIEYEESLERVESVLERVLDLYVSNNRTCKDYALLGIESFDDSAIKYAVAINCRVGSQFSVKREVLKEIKIAFDKEGINIPYNKLDVNLNK